MYTHGQISPQGLHHDMPGKIGQAPKQSPEESIPFCYQAALVSLDHLQEAGKLVMIHLHTGKSDRWGLVSK